MFNDVKEIWMDGERAVIHFQKWVPSRGYYLAVTNLSAIKCYEDEEVKDGKNYIPYAQRKNGIPPG